MAEADACLQAIIYAKEMGFDNICVEGDVLTILKKLQAKEADIFVIVWGRQCEDPRYRVEEAPLEVERVIAEE
ncbi:hypothetical protein J1N35_044471 [Gossypium stocksii]|uniref:RNase H type-1 domain-containing protein n=1 Tax=Gossypium stocksii TaxID=47602 RepID=A0A9D3U996_9ROSI|nr:hypothetical protein J1N35_044471 [Gossypium stocksii]